MTKSEWIRRFAAKLCEIQGPACTEAVSIAMTTYPDASDLSPEEAAEIYALEEPPGDVGAPGG